LDFVVPDLDFVASGLDFVAPVRRRRYFNST
jgi:hypothetical protein